MVKSEVQKRIEKLKEVINYHRYLYHVQNRQEISPQALDSLKHELYTLEQKYPEFITPDSPTQRVAGKPSDGFAKVAHEIPMLSIEDIFTEEELQDWQEYLERLEKKTEFEFFSELKIDGFAIALIYENGIFNRGATRGSGLVGEDVTQNLKTIESIPLKLQLHVHPHTNFGVGVHGMLPLKESEEKIKKLIKRGNIEVRGEVYMEKKAFEKFNEEQRKKGFPAFANPRNLAAGSIRQLDPKLASSRPLKFLAYDIVTDLGQKKHSESHQILQSLGFKTDPGKICQNLDEIIEFWREVAKKRESLPFLIDGVVININDEFLFKKLGVVGKSPRGVRAFKFSPKQATTIIENIVLQVGRTGAVTPVAHLKPVEVGGITITRATLHNEDEIKRLGVKIGDTVIVERAGDVIPAVAKVITELRTGKEKEFHFPKTCQVCLSNLIKPEGEVVWRCPNPDCGAKKREFLCHFSSRKAFNIEGLGPKIIGQLIEENLISQASDIFQLKEGDLLPLERFAEKKTGNILEAVEKSKKISLAKFIFALGIRHVGEETAQDLSYYFGSIDKFKEVSREEFDKIPEVGPEISKSIFNWLQEKRNQKLIKDLLSAGIEIIPPEKISKKLQGLKFVLTGSLENMTREEVKNKIRLLGGEVSETVSKETDYVILGKDPGLKLEKAKQFGIKTIGEKEFLKMLK